MSADVLDLVGRRARTLCLWAEAGQSNGHCYIAAFVAEARTRWEAAGAIPGLLRSFLPPLVLQWWQQGDAEAAQMGEISAYVDMYWPIITAELPMPEPGWAAGWAPSPEQQAELAVEIALRDFAD